MKTVAMPIYDSTCIIINTRCSGKNIHLLKCREHTSIETPGGTKANKESNIERQLQLRSGEDSTIKFTSLTPPRAGGVCTQWQVLMKCHSTTVYQGKTLGWRRKKYRMHMSVSMPWTVKVDPEPG